MKTWWTHGEHILWKPGENLILWKPGEHIVKPEHFCQYNNILSQCLHLISFFPWVRACARFFVLQNKLEKRARGLNGKKVFTFSWEVIHWIRQAWWKPGENLMEFRKLVFYATNMEQNLVNSGNSVKNFWDSDTMTNLVKTREKPRWKSKEL